VIKIHYDIFATNKTSIKNEIHQMQEKSNGKKSPVAPDIFTKRHCETETLLLLRN
jgi:hypothetical protein